MRDGWKPVLFAACVTTVALGLSAWGLLSHDQMRRACFDDGRKVGGAVQRIFDARSNGDEPLKGDQDTASQIPEGCR